MVSLWVACAPVRMGLYCGMPKWRAGKSKVASGTQLSALCHWYPRDLWNDHMLASDYKGEPDILGYSRSSQLSLGR